MFYTTYRRVSFKYTELFAFRIENIAFCAIRIVQIAGELFLVMQEFWKGIVLYTLASLRCYLCYDRGTRHEAGSRAQGRSCPFYRSTQVEARPPPRVAPPRNHAHTFGPIRSIGLCLTTCRRIATICIYSRSLMSSRHREHFPSE